MLLPVELAIVLPTISMKNTALPLADSFDTDFLYYFIDSAEDPKIGVLAHSNNNKRPDLTLLLTL